MLLRHCRGEGECGPGVEVLGGLARVGATSNERRIPQQGDLGQTHQARPGPGGHLDALGEIGQEGIGVGLPAMLHQTHPYRCTS